MKRTKVKDSPVVDDILAKLDIVFPNKYVLTPEEIAFYCGKTPQTMRRYFKNCTDKIVFAHWLADRQCKGEPQ